MSWNTAFSKFQFKTGNKKTFLFHCWLRERVKKRLLRTKATASGQLQQQLIKHTLIIILMKYGLRGLSLKQVQTAALHNLGLLCYT